MGIFWARGGVGVARAWRGRGAGMSCSPVAELAPGPVDPGGNGGAAGAAREKNEEIAAPQALPGARTCTPTML
eukprot:gene14877-biopygen8137